MRRLFVGSTSSPENQGSRSERAGSMNYAQLTLSAVLSLLLAATAAANTQLVLGRGVTQNPDIQYTGVVDLAIAPGLDNARVTVVVDGQKIADGLVSPYHVVVDFGSTAIQIICA